MQSSQNNQTASPATQSNQEILRSTTRLLTKKRIAIILLTMLLLLVIGGVSIAILSINNNQTLPKIQTIKKNIYKGNSKFAEYAKENFGAPKINPKTNQLFVDGLLNGRNDIDEINIETADGPSAFKITDETRLQELAIVQHIANNTTESATLKLSHVYTVSEFIKNVPDGSMLRVTYISKNNINIATEIDYIK